MDADNCSDASSENTIDLHGYMMQELQSLFDYTPPPLIRDPEWEPQEPTNPFWFYDKHLDENLQLLHVKPIPTLLETIASTVDTAMEEHGDALPPIGRRGVFVLADLRNYRDIHRCTTTTDDRSVARFYNDTTATSCEAVASMLGIHPRASEWLPALMWTQRHNPPPQPPGTSAEGYSIRVSYNWRDDHLVVEPQLMEDLGDNTIQELEDVARKFRDLATWQIGVVCDCMEAIFRDMDRVIASDKFQPKICQTRGHISSSSICTHTPDAKVSPWTIGEPSSGTSLHEQDHLARPERLHRSHLRRSARLCKPSSSFAQSASPDTVSVNRRSINGKRGVDSYNSSPKGPAIKEQLEVRPAVEADYRSYTAEDLLQHAWTRSVHNDTTIIVFHCGNFERIGIRHRKSQTLYLSKLIDIARDKDPAYGKLHIGLYIAAFKDAIDRAAQLHEIQQKNVSSLATSLSTSIKRRVEGEHSETKRARQKVKAFDQQNDTTYSNMDKQVIYREAGRRNLALIRIQHDGFNSISPASFLRVGRSLVSNDGKVQLPRAHRKYSVHEYLTLVVHSTIAHGATGILHEAQLVLESAEGETLRSRVVVKFAFSAEQQDRMEHEYSIYDHLVSAGIHGIIVDILGLFEDLEGGPTALIMSHAGSSLWNRRSSTKDIAVKASSTQRAAFLEAMQKIHDAGVRHNDLSPSNLLVNDAGQVTIVDFDRADLISSKGARRRELARLADTLDGKYFPPDGFSSEPTTPTSGFRSAFTEGTKTPTGSVMTSPGT